MKKFFQFLALSFLLTIVNSFPLFSQKDGPALNCEEREIIKENRSFARERQERDSKPQGGKQTEKQSSKKEGKQVEVPKTATMAPKVLPSRNSSSANNRNTINVATKTTPKAGKSYASLTTYQIKKEEAAESNARAITVGQISESANKADRTKVPDYDRKKTIKEIDKYTSIYQKNSVGPVTVINETRLDPQGNISDVKTTCIGVQGGATVSAGLSVGVEGGVKDCIVEKTKAVNNCTLPTDANKYKNRSKPVFSEQ